MKEFQSSGSFCLELQISESKKLTNVNIFVSIWRSKAVKKAFGYWILLHVYLFLISLFDFSSFFSILVSNLYFPHLMLFISHHLENFQYASCKRAFDITNAHLQIELSTFVQPLAWRCSPGAAERSRRRLRLSQQRLLLFRNK